MLTAAAEKYSLFVQIICSANGFDVSSATPQPGDMLFNVGRGSGLAETLLTQPGVAGVRTALNPIIGSDYDTVVYSAALERAGLPAPKTIYGSVETTQQKSQCVEYLGGYPVVIKVRGLSKGVGVLYCESYASFSAQIDYLNRTNRQYIIREFFPHTAAYRITVLGTEVLASTLKPVRRNDFRTGSKDMKLINTTQSLQKISILAAAEIGSEFCGVDVIAKGEEYNILEINPPCDFTYLPSIGFDGAAEKIVAYLMRKSTQII